MFGAIYRNTDINSIFMVIAAFSAALIAAGGYVINDYYDKEIDSINKKDRVLPSGLISLQTAFKYSLVLFLSGIILSFFLKNFICTSIAIINSLLLFFYARNLKKQFLTGNLVVAFAAASTFIYGAIANTNLKNGFIIGIYAFLFTLIREFIKDIEDSKADSFYKAKTLPIILGKKNTMIIATLISILLWFINYYLFRIGYLNLITFIIVLLLAILPLTLILIYLLFRTSEKDINLAAKVIKADMVAVLIFFWLGHYYENL